MHHFTAPVNKSVKHTALRNSYCGMSSNPLPAPPPLQYVTLAEDKTDIYQGSFPMAKNIRSSDLKGGFYSIKSLHLGHLLL